MTTLNNDELRKVGKHTVWHYDSSRELADYIVKYEFTSPNARFSSYIELIEYYTALIDQYIATHDQQLLEAILEGIVDADDTRGDTQNGNNPKYWTRRTKVINERNEEIRQHIKSVFEGRK